MFKRVFLLFILHLSLLGCILPAVEPISTDKPELTKIIPGEIPPQPDTPTPEGDKTRTPQPGDMQSNPDLQPTEAPERLPTPFIRKQFKVQPGSPKWLENFAHPEAACNWMGVGGQIFEADGNPVSNLVIKLSGSVEGKAIEMIALTGGALYLGPGGYEFKISDHPIDTNNTLGISVLDEDGNLLSEPFYFSTFNACEKNFVLVNFVDSIIIVNSFYTYLPFILAGE